MKFFKRKPRVSIKDASYLQISAAGKDYRLNFVQDYYDTCKYKLYYWSREVCEIRLPTKAHSRSYLLGLLYDKIKSDSDLISMLVLKCQNLDKVLYEQYETQKRKNHEARETTLANIRITITEKTD